MLILITIVQALTPNRLSDKRMYNHKVTIHMLMLTTHAVKQSTDIAQKVVSTEHQPKAAIKHPMSLLRFHLDNQLIMKTRMNLIVGIITNYEE